jgi:hypothetical protein
LIHLVFPYYHRANENGYEKLEREKEISTEHAPGSEKAETIYDF